MMDTTRRKFISLIAGGSIGLLTKETAIIDAKNVNENSFETDYTKQWKDLRCSGCGKPLSVFFHEDRSNRKTVGCVQCLKNPVITHSDWNKIMEKLGLICDVG